MEDTNKILQIVIEELGLDPEDASVRETIESLIAGRPDVPINESFIQELRSKLLERAHEQTLHPTKQSFNVINYFMNKTFVAAVLVLLILAAGGAWIAGQSNPSLLKIANKNGSDTELLSGKYAVTELSANSFGELTTANLASNGRSGNRTLESAGGDNAGTFAPNTSQPESKMIAPGEPYPNTPSDTSLPFPGGEVYTFTYTGEALANLAQTESVYKRAKPVQSSSFIDRIIQTISLGLIDLTKFRDAELQSFTINENRDFGYSLNVSVDQGAVNIFQNWEKWPQPFVDCREEECFTQNRIKMEDLPSDEEAISIATNFLNEYSISTAGYGQPKVQNQWRAMYENILEKANFYFPEQVQVVFPLMLNGQLVYDESGNLHGMSVIVDARTKRAISLNELTTKQFETSDYVGETDAKRIVGIAERGGFRNYPYTYPGAKEIKLELGTPTREMVNMWYSKDGKAGQPLYIPALIFPIKNSPKTNYWRQNVIVPLVKEVLDSDNQPPITIFDAIQGSATSGSSGAPETRSTDPLEVPERETPLPSGIAKPAPTTKPSLTPKPTVIPAR